MKLYYAETSPYARKVRVTILEKGLQDQVALAHANPFEETAALTAINPLGKVPALALADGASLYDSRVVCRYLNSLAPAPELYPGGADGWRVARTEAMADGMLDALFALVMERRRPEAQQSPIWAARWMSAFFRACDEALNAPPAPTGPVTMAHIGLGAALGYADFRTPDLDWRDGRPALADWSAAFAERPSMQATRPPAG